MKYIEYQNRLDYLLELIKIKSACSPKLLARQFNCSEKTIRNMVNHLREMGYDIKWNKN